MVSTARATQDREEQEVLLPRTHDHDEDDLSPITKRKERTERWKRVAIYTALVLLGIILGSVITQGVGSSQRQGTGEKKKGDDGPRVPPIYKLPPVSWHESVMELTFSQVDCREIRHT